MSIVAQSHTAVLESDYITGTAQILQEGTPCVLKGDTFAVKEGPFVVKVDINYEDEEGASEGQHICTQLYVDGVCIRGFIGRASPFATYTFDRHRVDTQGGQNEMKELTFARPKVKMTFLVSQRSTCNTASLPTFHVPGMASKLLWSSGLCWCFISKQRGWRQHRHHWSVCVTGNQDAVINLSQSSNPGQSCKVSVLLTQGVCVPP